MAALQQLLMMNFRQKIYDAAKDQRYGMLFFGTLVGLLGFLAASRLFIEWVGWQDYLHPFLLTAGILILALSWRLARRARRGGKSAREQLSRDEMLKARSKLRNEVKPVRPPVIRGPDIDLKY